MIMPVRQICPECRQEFMGSDVLGRPYFYCSQTGAREKRETQEQIDAAILALAGHKWLDPECAGDGCQSLIWKARYEKAHEALQAAEAEVSRLTKRVEELLRPFGSLADTCTENGGWANTDEITLQFDDVILGRIEMSRFRAARDFLQKNGGGNG